VQLQYYKALSDANVVCKTLRWKPDSQVRGGTLYVKLLHCSDLHQRTRREIKVRL